MNQQNEITILSPATVANVVCGFDILGFCLDGPFDKMLIRKVVGKGVTIINKDEYNLPTEPSKNVIGAALLALLEEVQEDIGFVVESTKIIKPGSGIGSSAASAAGSVVGANHLLNKTFSNDDLVRFAMCGEEVASGSKHADNIAPCIYGGVTLIRSNEPLDIVTIPAPPLVCYYFTSPDRSKNFRCKRYFKKTSVAERCHCAVGKHCRFDCRVYETGL